MNVKMKECEIIILINDEYSITQTKSPKKVVKNFLLWLSPK